MQRRKSTIGLGLVALIAIATAAGLTAAYKRFHAEAANRRIEIALEWQEITLLAQSTGQPLPSVLAAFKAQNVTTLVLAEDTLTSLEQSGGIHPTRATLSPGRPVTVAIVDEKPTMDRIAAALKLRAIATTTVRDAEPPDTRTIFQWNVKADSNAHRNLAGTGAEGIRIAIPADYSQLRTMGIGLSPEAVDAAKAAGLRIAGRIGNFPGVTETSARAALESLRSQGVSTVIFNGEEVLGYRGL